MIARPRISNQKETPSKVLPIGVEPKTPFSQTNRMIRRPEVCEITSIPSSSLTDLISRGDFPKPFKLSERMAAWKLSEVVSWMESCPRADTYGGKK